MHATTGETSILSNIGSMRNKGIEFTINTHFNLGKVQWNSSLNIARNVNKLTALLEDDMLSIGSNRALKIGGRSDSWYIFRKDGLYQYDGEVPAARSMTRACAPATSNTGTATATETSPTTTVS